MTQVIAIPFSRWMELAIAAGHRADNIVNGTDKTLTTQHQLNYIKFAHAIAEELQQCAIEDILLERIVEIAKQHGYKEQNWDSLGDSVNATLHNSAMEMMYTRYAYRVAAELHKPS